jgi:hypothetical protein
MALVLPDLIPAQMEGLLSLIRGEVKTGKTALLSHLVSRFVSDGFNHLVVMDFAPKIMRGVGGKMPLPSDDQGLRVYSPSITPPRLSGGSPEEVAELARANGVAIDRVLADYQRSPGQTLFINDVSLYLQAREPEILLEALATTPTVVMNGYQGVSLGEDQFSQQERARMERLAVACDVVIDLPIE